MLAVLAVDACLAVARQRVFAARYGVVTVDSVDVVSYDWRAAIAVVQSAAAGNGAVIHFRLLQRSLVTLFADLRGCHLSFPFAFGEGTIPSSYYHFTISALKSQALSREFTKTHENSREPGETRRGRDSERRHGGAPSTLRATLSL